MLAPGLAYVSNCPNPTVCPTPLSWRRPQEATWDTVYGNPRHGPNDVTRIITRVQLTQRLFVMGCGCNGLGGATCDGLVLIGHVMV